MELPPLIEKIVSIIVPLLFAVTLHETAHGYVANFYGDPTAKRLGRLTLNPIPHIDLIGTLIIPATLFFVTKGAFCFGYAKPVPIVFHNLHRPKLHMIYVALAGPLANFFQAVFWSLLLISSDVLFAEKEISLFAEICKFGVLINVVLFVINLFPLPPLDGGRVISGLLPRKPAEIFSKIEPFGFFIVLTLLLAGILNEFWIKPLMNLTLITIDFLTYPIKFLLINI